MFLEFVASPQEWTFLWGFPFHQSNFDFCFKIALPRARKEGETRAPTNLLLLVSAPKRPFTVSSADGSDISDTSDDAAEYIADGWPQDGQDDDHDQGHEHEDQRIFDYPLGFGSYFPKHDFFLQMNDVSSWRMGQKIGPLMELASAEGVALGTRCSSTYCQPLAPKVRVKRTR